MAIYATPSAHISAVWYITKLHITKCNFVIFCVLSAFCHMSMGIKYLYISNPTKLAKWPWPTFSNFGHSTKIKVQRSKLTYCFPRDHASNTSDPWWISAPVTNFPITTSALLFRITSFFSLLLHCTLLLLNFGISLSNITLKHLFSNHTQIHLLTVSTKQ